MAGFSRGESAYIRKHGTRDEDNQPESSNGVLVHAQICSRCGDSEALTDAGRYYCDRCRDYFCRFCVVRHVGGCRCPICNEPQQTWQIPDPDMPGIANIQYVDDSLEALMTMLEIDEDNVEGRPMEMCDLCHRVVRRVWNCQVCGARVCNEHYLHGGQCTTCTYPPDPPDLPLPPEPTRPPPGIKVLMRGQ